MLLGPRAGAQEPGRCRGGCSRRSRRHRVGHRGRRCSDCKCARPVTAVTVSAIHRPGVVEKSGPAVPWPEPTVSSARRKQGVRAVRLHGESTALCDMRCNPDLGGLDGEPTWSPLASRSSAAAPTVMCRRRGPPPPGCSTPAPDGTADSGDFGDGRLSDIPGLPCGKSR